MILAATGHRPDKLGGYTTDIERRLDMLAATYIDKLKPEKIISGMALGWDMAVARAARHHQIPYIAAVPFLGQESRWAEHHRVEYNRLLKWAERVEFVSPPGYDPMKMQVRNIWMVDNCDHILALWNGGKGGTYNCILYANHVQRPITNAWEGFIEL